MKLTKFFYITIVICISQFASAATGIFGGYLTVDGTKYKSSSTYGGSETVFSGKNLGIYDSSATLNLTQFETLTFAYDGHSTFDFAFAYRIRPTSSSVSTNPADYTFLIATNGGSDDGVSIGGNDEKGEWTGTVNLLSGLANDTYALDIVHKVGAYEGGSNFDRLASLGNTNPGATIWSEINPYSATFTVIPETSASLLGGLGALLILRRRR